MKKIFPFCVFFLITNVSIAGITARQFLKDINSNNPVQKISLTYFWNGLVIGQVRQTKDWAQFIVDEKIYSKLSKDGKIKLLNYFIMGGGCFDGNSMDIIDEFIGFLRFRKDLMDLQIVTAYRIFNKSTFDLLEKGLKDKCISRLIIIN